MSKEKQLNFGTYSEEFKEYWRESGRKVHGGTRAKGKRKTARPFRSNKPIHVVMRSTGAIGSYSMLHSKNRGEVNAIVYTQADNAGIRIYNYSNNGNHLHILLCAKQKAALQTFLRAAAGMIARHILKANARNAKSRNAKAHHAKPQHAKGKFWDALAFTKIAEWGRFFDNLKSYVAQNILEAAGVIAYQARKNRAPPLKS